MFQCNMNMVVNLEVEAIETQSVLTPIVTFVNILQRFTATFLAMHIQISFLLQGLFLKTGKSVIFLQISSKNKNPHRVHTQGPYVRRGAQWYQLSHTCPRTHILTEWKRKNSLLNFNINSHFSHISYVFTPSVWLVYFLGREKNCESDSWIVMCEKLSAQI